MKTVSTCVSILLSLILLANFCYAAEGNLAAFQPTQGADITKNGEEAQEEKVKFLPHHIPPFFKMPFKSIPHPIVKKPIPHHRILKKPKPHYPPLFPSHP